MFAENEKISWLQMRSQLLLSALGVGMLCGIPGFTGREGIFGILLGGGIMILWSGILCRQMAVFRDPVRYFGKTVTWMLVGIWESYLVFSGGWLVAKISQLVSTYLVSGVSQNTLALVCVLAALGGSHHIQARGRMAQTVWPLIAWMTGILLFLAAYQMQKNGIMPVEDAALDGVQILKKTRDYVAYNFGIGLAVWLNVQTGREGGKKEKVGLHRAVGQAAMWFLSGAILLTWNFGTESERMNHCPVLEIMAGVEIPGKFLRRVDLIFLSVLLFSLLLLLGSIFFYSNYITERIHRPVTRIPAAVLCLLAGTAGEQTWNWTRYYPDLLRRIYLPVWIVLTLCAAWARRKSYGEK